VSISKSVMTIARCSLNTSGTVIVIWFRQSAEHIHKNEKHDNWNSFLPHTTQTTLTVTVLWDLHNFFTFVCPSFHL
jgi:hypothetical protein